MGRIFFFLNEIKLATLKSFSDVRSASDSLTKVVWVGRHGSVEVADFSH